MDPRSTPTKSRIVVMDVDHARQNVFQIDPAHVRRRFHTRTYRTLGNAAPSSTASRRSRTTSKRKKKKTTPIATHYRDTALDLPTQPPATTTQPIDDAADAASVYFYEIAGAVGPGDGWALPPTAKVTRTGGPPTQKKVTLYEKWNALIPLLGEPVMRASSNLPDAAPATPCSCSMRTDRVVCVYWTRVLTVVLHDCTLTPHTQTLRSGR